MPAPRAAMGSGPRSGSTAARAPNAANRRSSSKSQGGRPGSKMKKMDHNPKKRKEQQEKADKLLKLFCVRKMQRLFRVKKIRGAVKAVHQLEDVVLDEIPTPGIEAYQLLFDGPNPELTGGALGFELAMQAYKTGDEDPSDPGTVVSRATTTKSRYSEEGSGVSGSGSRPSSSGSQNGFSESTDDSEPLGPRLNVELLAFRLDEWGVEEAGKMARLIFWIMDCGDELTPENLECICRHHRIRRRNQVSRIVLHLILVHPGDSKITATTEGDATQLLLPEGWEQVTRTGWGLRAMGPEWTPGLVLRGSARCYAETAERLQLVADDGGGDDGTFSPASTFSHHARSSRASFRGSIRRGSSMASSRFPGRSFPAARECDALDFPRRNRPTKLECPAAYDLAEELGKAVYEIDPPPTDPTDQPNEPTPTLLIGGASVLELLLACLVGTRPRDELVHARLTGGDAIFLKSPFMCQLSGHGDRETWRSGSELWEEAMKRDDWQVIRHIRGDGRGLPSHLGGLPPPPIPLVTRRPDSTWLTTEMKSTWDRYAGAPLILGDKEYALLRERAGMEILPLHEHVQRPLKALTKNAPKSPRPGDEEPAPAPTRRFGMFGGIGVAHASPAAGLGI